MIPLLGVSVTIQGDVTTCLEAVGLIPVFQEKQFEKASFESKKMRVRERQR